MYNIVCLCSPPIDTPSLSNPKYRYQKMKLNYSSLSKQEVVDLCGKKLKHDDIKVISKVLKKSKLIETLKMSNNQLTLEDTEFTNALGTNDTVQNLWLRNNNIGSTGANNLAKSLKSNSTLKSILLTGNRIGHDGIASLVEALLENDTLESLSLNDNPIGISGVKSMATLLSSGECSLKILYLNKINLGDKGIALLANALKENDTLECLEIANNNITHVGAQSLELALEDNNTLQKVNMAHNNIGNEGVGCIATALIGNRSLNVLDLSHNNIGNEGAEAMAESLSIRGNNTLRELKLTGNDISNGDKIFADLKDKSTLKIQMGGSGSNKGIHKRSRRKKSSPNSIIQCTKKKKARLNQTNVPTTSLELSLQTETKLLATGLASSDSLESEKIATLEAEKISAEKALENVKEDLEDKQEDVDNQVLYTNYLQSKIDELAAVAEEGGADRAKVAEIKGRSYTSM